jgi:DNA-directed RNA polymerase subunit beta'
MAITTPGRYLITQALPEQYRDFQGALDGKQVKRLFTQMAKELSPDEYKQRLKALNQIGNVIATEYGGVASIHLSDLKIPPSLQALRRELDKEVYKLQQSRELSSEDKKKAIIQVIREATPTIDKLVVETLGKQENSFGLQVATGVRGKPQQLRQLVFGDLLSLDSKMREVPVPTLRSYGEGITPLQYWVASHGGRQGYIGVQKATADAGYFAKQVRSAAHRQVITSNDCGKARPYIVDADDDNNIGSLLFSDTKGKSGKI